MLCLAAAKVGGIQANSKYPVEFIRDNLLIQTNVIDACYEFGVKRLLFLGSSCIYPKLMSAADSRGVFVDRAAGADESSLRDREDCRN